MSLEDKFVEAMGQFPGTVTAITTVKDGAPLGFIATAVCSLSTEPPSLIVCVNRQVSAHDALLERGAFGVNVLSCSHTSLVQQFIQRTGSERFKGIEWVAASSGAPLICDARIAMDCSIAAVHDGYSHSIVIGNVQSVDFIDDHADSSLLWQARGFRRAIELV